MNMEVIEIFKRLAQVCEDVAKAYENNDEKEIESALGRFMILMVQLDAIK